MRGSLKSINILWSAFAVLAFSIAAVKTPEASAREIEEVFKEMSDLENPFDLRDPFQPEILKKTDERSSSTPIRDGVYTNIPTLGGVNLDEVVITGVLIGPERRAFLRVGNSNTTYTIKEGMNLGPNDAEIKAILPGGIILAERVTNIYGEVEYLETVIPISE